MKTIILAGGFAKRLWPLTQDFPKSLLNIAGKPLLTYIVEKLNKEPEIEEIIISTNAKFEESFRNWIKTHRYQKKTNFIIEPATNEGEKFGAIKGLWYVIQKSGIEEEIMVINGDNLFDFEISDLIQFYKEKRTPVVAVFDVKEKEKAKLYGIVKTDENNMIIDFVEKPLEPPTTLASTGCYIFPANAVKMIGEYLDLGNPKDAPGFFMSWLVKRVPVHAFSFCGVWFDIGDPKSLKDAEEWARNKNE